MQLSPFLSQKFKFWSFVSMVLLVFVHGYNLEQRYLQPWTLPEEPLTFTSFTEYFLANGIFRFRIPMLFIISGYLYALHDYTPNKLRVGKRVRTLLTPYLIWSAFGIAATYALEFFPYTKHLVTDSHIMQIDNTRTLIHEYHWYEVLARWIFFPVSYQLWFIRVLLIYNLAYRPILWCVTHKVAQKIFFGIAIFLWLTTAGFILFEGEGLLFFSLGVWIQKNNFAIDKSKNWMKPALIIFLITAIGKSILAFKGYAYFGDAIFPILSLLHKLCVISGLITCWYGLDILVSWFMNQKWFVWLASFSFIIYAAHAPFVAIFINGMFEMLGRVQGYRMITFIFLPIIIIGCCILLGAVLRKIAPKFYSVLTGGRGM
ncbi:MAG: acyltransferase family protein [Cyclobacteriaceae bacterium]